MKSHYLILIAPDERLTRVAKPIDLDRIRQDPESLNVAVETILEVIRKVDAVGLAAPQLGLPMRLVVTDLEEEGPKVYVNPSYEPLTSEGEETKIERCFSAPYIDVPVSRPKRIMAHWFDRFGAEWVEPFEGFAARVFQHETDHLEGHCLYERLTEPEKTAYLYHTDSLRVRLAAKRASRGIE